MMYDFGYNFSRENENHKIIKKIKELEKTFDLIMISDKMEESLILLKHLMCWKTEDIVSFSLNKKIYKTNIPSKFVREIKRLNKFDFLLYEYFKKIFDKKIEHFGNDKMKKEIEDLRRVSQKFISDCNVKAKQINNKTSKKFSILKDPCISLSYSDQKDFINRLRLYQISKLK